MIGLYNSRFVKFQYNEGDGILQQTWNYTHHRNHLHFYQSINQFLHIIDEYKASKILIDFSNFTFCLDAQSQKWVEKNVINKLATKNVTRVALIKSSDNDTQDSLYMLFNMGGAQSIATHFFDNVTEAKQWLVASATKGGSARRQKMTTKVLSGM